MRPLGRFRLRRWLLTGSLLTGGVSLLGHIRRAFAALPGVESSYQAPNESGAPPGPGSEQATPVIMPGPFFRPSTGAPPSEAIVDPPTNSWFEIGRSLQDAPIKALRLGAGPVRLALMGSIHGGWERNTERLVMTAYEHFIATPSDLPSAVSVFFVPT